MTKTAGISKGMAQWIEDFVAGLNQDKLNKKAEGEQIDTNTTPVVDEPVAETPVDPSADQSTVDYFNDEKTAAINVYDLPKVVWNDETFYVLFDQETGKATILNQFTNVVTTVQASTIEEVDDALNGLQIVTSKEQNLGLKIAEELIEQINEDLDIQPLDEIEEDVIDDQIEEVVEEPKEDKDDIINKMQSQIDSLTEQINILKQQYARTEEVINLDLGVEEAEVQHFNETAEETAEQIQEDNDKDITTPQGRSTLRERLLNDLNDVIEEIPSDDQIEVDVLDTEDVEEEIITDESGDQEVEENTVDSIEFEHPSVVDEQLYMEDTKNQENKLDDFSNEEELVEEEVDEEEEFEILTGKDANIFKQAVCPNCGGNLVKANLVKSFQGIVCKGECNSEYAVNLDNETIFKKRGAK